MPLTEGDGRQAFLHPTDRRKRQKKLYGSARWARLRQGIFERDNYVCQVRLKKCRGRANVVDHIIRSEEGGAEYDPANLRACCRSGNMVRHNAAYFREKVDAAAVSPLSSGRPPSGDRRYLEWAMSLPLGAEPVDHHHGR